MELITNGRFTGKITALFLIASLSVLLITCQKPERAIKINTLETTAADISYTSATLKGEIIDMGSQEAVGYGIIVSETASYDDPGVLTKDLGSRTSKGTFQAQFTDLKNNATYFFWAYASANNQKTYGTAKQFTTKAYGLPTVTTTAVTEVATTSGKSGGDVSDDGGQTVSARGICWSTSADPTVTDNKIEGGSGTGTFSCNITGLTDGTSYHIRAYATNSVGTAYGADVSFQTFVIVVNPTVTTYSVTSIGQTTATGGGTIVSDGKAAITAKGVCWSTSTNPTISDSRTTNGSGLGSFSSSITGLTPATTYHVRAYATNSSGTGYGSDAQFITKAIVSPTVTTTSASSTGYTTATAAGNITDDGGAGVTARGICWGTSANPGFSGSFSTEGTGSGTFSSTITGLTPGTSYHARAYATNSVGTSFGSDLTFSTNSPVPPTVSTSAVSSRTTTSVSCGGNVSDEGGASVIEKGLCWGTTTNPTIANNKLALGSGTGSYSGSITGLDPETNYHVRAYATNPAGTGYGSDVLFTTVAIALPTISTTAVSGITATAASSGGSVSSDGGASVTACGICWSTSTNPTISNPHTTDGSGVISFSSSLSGLLPQTTYHVRAYATNSKGTAYGSDLSFITASVNIATITTSTVSAITAIAATGGGNISDDGGSAVTERGICWSTSQSPTLADNKIAASMGGSGQFYCSMTNLSPGTTYYVKAYAINGIGTSYGDQVSFVTSKTAPTLTTKSVTSITAMGGISGGVISSTGGGTISAKGICWGESNNPTLSDHVVSSGNGPASYNSSIITAVPGTTYYVRAYATNEAGTGYGDEKSFIALSNVTYYGFESGTIPAGWGGAWSVSSVQAFQSSYSLKSVTGTSCDATLTITVANAGQISFYYYLDKYTDIMGYYHASSIDFYIDNVLAGSFPSSSVAASWNQAVFDISAGAHIFKWHFNASGASGYIDYIILPQ